VKRTRVGPFLISGKGARFGTQTRPPATQGQGRYSERTPMGERLRAIREAKDLHQGDIEKRTGLLRIYV
jgi:hypothetical protein